MDLNRNLPTGDWSAKAVNPRYPSGSAPASEPETRALLAALERVKASTVISLHSFKKSFVEVERPPEALPGYFNDCVQTFVDAVDIERKAAIGYPTPGALGSYGRENRLLVLTYELRRGTSHGELQETLPPPPPMARQGGAAAQWNNSAEPSEAQQRLLDALAQGPATLEALRQRTGLEHPRREAEELIRRRALLRIALTPTDLFCAEGRIPLFSSESAVHALGLHARMLDMTPEAFRDRLLETVRRQSTALLAVLLGAFDPALDANDPVVERLTAMLLAPPEGREVEMRMDPRQPLVLVGAAAPMLFAGAPGPLRGRMVNPEHGEVANAVGAITSRFVLRESVTVEPVLRGGVEVFDHQGKTPFATLAEGLAHARAVLEDRLSAGAKAHGLNDTRLEWNEELIEDYADFASRTRKELVIARVEAILTGMPG